MSKATPVSNSNVHDHPKRIYSARNKYVAVGQLLRGFQGSLLDIGARDRQLAKYLDLTRTTYFSADVDEGHDYQIDLEQKVDLPDHAFDIVVALDVLEHIEHIHAAFAELARLAGTHLIIALPNAATLPRRLSFLWTSNLRTRKYDLLPEHQGDRHRWLTIYPQINEFVRVNAERAGFTQACIVEEIEGGRWVSRIASLAATSGILPPGILTTRCIYALRRK
jgi:hypothetical protein